MLSKKEPVLDIWKIQPMQIACPGNKAKDVAEQPFTKVTGM